MTVIKLKSGGLWVHAPIAPTKECIQVLFSSLFLLMCSSILVRHYGSNCICLKPKCCILFSSYLKMSLFSPILLSWVLGVFLTCFFFFFRKGHSSFCDIPPPTPSFCLIAWVVNPFCTKNPSIQMLIKVKLSPLISTWFQNALILNKSVSWWAIQEWYCARRIWNLV